MGLYENIVGTKKKKEEKKTSEIYERIINSNTASQNYELQKQVVDNLTKERNELRGKIYDNNISLPTKNTTNFNLLDRDTTNEKSVFDKKTQEENLQKLKVANKKADNDIKLKEIEDKLSKESNNLKYDDYLKRLEKVNNEKTSLWDKTGGVIVRGAADLFSNFDTNNKYVNERGKTEYLPTYNELKQQKVSQDYSNPFTKFLGDAGYNITKIGTSQLLDRVTGAPMGSALYWTDMATDSYKNAINQGYDKTNAMAYSLATTGLEYATGKVLGGATGKLTQGSAKELDKALSNVLVKVTNNPTLSRIIATGGSEFTEEFVQEYLDNINKLLLLENSTNPNDYLSVFTDADILGDALYSGLVGFVSGGTIESANGSDVSRNIKMFETFKEQLETRKANTTDKTKIEQYDKVIESIDNYLKNPFSIDNKTTEQTENNIANLPVIENNAENINLTENLIQYQEKMIQQQEAKKQELQQEETNRRMKSIEQQLEEQGTRILEESEAQKQAMIEHFKEYLEENNITNPTQNDIDDAIVDNLIYDNELDAIDTKKVEQLYNQYAKEYMKENGIPFNNSPSKKQQQFEIIQKYNPVDKSLGEHTWINNVDDIKTFKEAIEDDAVTTPDFTEKMIDEALETGKITVYSSYPIEQGTFVTPSKMEAQGYAGDGKVYSKEVPLEDVAWIDSLQGQYAKVPSIPTARDFKQDINLPVNQEININDIKNITEYNMKEREDYNQIQNMSIEKVMKYYNNPGGRPNFDMSLLKNHIKDIGLLNPIFISKETNNISDGHHRFVAAYELGMDTVPVKFIDSSKDIELDNNEWYNLLEGEISGKRKTITTNDEGVQAKSINDNWSNETSKGTSSSGTSDRVYTKNEGYNNGSSNKTIHGRNTAMEQGLEKSPFILPKVEQKVNKQSYDAIKKAANAGKSYLQLKYNEVKTLKNELKDYLGLSKQELTNSKTYNGIKDKIQQFANKQVEYLDEDLKRVKNEIRNTNIKVDSNLKEQITDYNDFKKSNFGKLKLSNTGQSIDSIYQELSNAYPYYFDSNIDTEADMLYALSDFMDRPNSIIEEYKLSDSDIEKATEKIFNALVDNSLSNEAIEEIQNDILEKYSRRTRKEVQEELLYDMGVTIEDLSKGKDISSIGFQRTDPIRVNEKVFGAETGQKMNDATINRTKHNEAEGTRFLNRERSDIKELGIKPRSKESAAVQKYGEKQYLNDNGELVKYGDKELANEFKSEEVQNKIKHAAEVIRNKYDKYIDQINSVITKLGYDPIPKRTDYMRHFQELNDKLSQWGIPLNPTDMSKDALPTDINGLTDQFKPGKNWFASALQRKGFKTTYDAITGIDGYLESAKDLIYHTEDIQRYRALSKFIRETYGQEHGMDNIDPSTAEGQKRLNDIFDNKLSKYAAWLDEQANALAGKKGKIDRGLEEALGRKVYTILDTAKKQVGSNMTGFNVRSALTNFASAVQGAAKTKKISFLKGTISTLQNIIHKDNLIDKSDFLTSRFGSDQLSKKLWQKASNAGQIFMTGTDYFTANQIWRSKYYENLDSGMSESQAIKSADDFAARIMGDRSKGATASIFNSKTLGLLTQFQLEVNNQWSSLIHDNKMDIQRGNKSGATVVFQLGELAAMSYFFNNFMRSLTGSDVMIDPIDMLKKIIGGDDDDDEEKTIEQRATEVFGDLINDLPFVSFFTGGRIPISEAFKGGTTLFSKLTNQKDKYGNDIKWDDVRKDLTESAFYWLLPTGYGQVRKTYKGASMYNNKLPIPGSYTDSGNLRFNADESIGGKTKALLFGQYSSDESQKYIERGYESIRKENLDEMKDLKMSASEYSKYRKGLNAAGTKQSEKIDYIANSNYTDSQKNIMASNVLKGKDFDIKEYKKYNSYDEYKYATENPEKYLLNQQIAPYDKYIGYKDEITNIRNNTTNDKEETIKYINSLKLNIPQKAMFIKQYYKSFKQYDKEIAEYVAKQSLTRKEKEEILTQLGFTIKDGRVYY